MQTLGRNLYIALSLLYTLAFLAWRLLLASPLHDAWPWLQASEIFGLFGYLPVPLLLPGALALRSRRALLALALPLVWFGVEYGRLFLPNDNQVEAGNTATLRVMTWNSANAIDFESRAITQLEAALEEVQPDLVLLQEINSEARLQLQIMSDEWPYQAWRTSGGRRLALLSKWPITPIEPATESDEAQHACQCLKALVAWRNQPIEVVVTHVAQPIYRFRRWHRIPLLAAFDSTRQMGTFDALLAVVASREYPLIMAGDFNTTERQPNYARLIQAGLHNAHTTSGWGFGLTYPRPSAIRRWWPLPLLRIDHIFYSEEWIAERSWTGFIRASDHLYVVADLLWQDSQWENSQWQNSP